MILQLNGIGDITLIAVINKQYLGGNIGILTLLN